MRKLLFSLLLVCSTDALADGAIIIVEPTVITPLHVMKLFDEQTNKSDIKGLSDLIDKEEKTAACVEHYVQKQSKSYSKKVQHTLYDLFHVRGLYSKGTSSVDYTDKIRALGKVQCEIYYNMNILK